MGQLNRGTLIDQALQRVGNNSESLKMQARTTLQRLLNDLYQQWDWPFLWATVPLTIPPAGIFALPDDFVKPEDDQALAFAATAVPIQEVDHRTFVQRTALGESGTPRIWTLDYRTRTGSVWPRPLESVPTTFRYKALPPSIPFSTGATTVYDADIPIFPWDSFLIDSLTEWGMSYEADPRRVDQITINEAMLQRLRGATYPERSFPSQVPLDPLFFSTPTWGSGRE